MKNNRLNITFVLLIAGQSALVYTYFAKTEFKAATSAPVTTISLTATASKEELLPTNDKQLEEEAIGVFAETPKAIIALKQGDTETATKILKVVSAKLDDMLAKYPDMPVIPADVEMNVKEYDGDNATLSVATNDAIKMLKAGKIQAARRLLAPIASEATMSVIGIPMRTFPGVVKQAEYLTKAHKTELAIATLDEGLKTFLESVKIMPLPVLRAEKLLSAAAEIEHSQDLSEVQIWNEIQKLTSTAQDSLKLAERLGYGDKNDFKQLYQAIDGINKGLIFAPSVAKEHIEYGLKI